MEEEPPPPSATAFSADLLGNALRPSSVRVSRSFRASNRSSSPRASASPSFRRLKTPKKDDEKSMLEPEWFVRSVRKLPWRAIIFLWLVLVLLMYSRGPVPVDDQNGEVRQNTPFVRGNTEKVKELSRRAREWIWRGYVPPNRPPFSRRVKIPFPDPKVQPGDSVKGQEQEKTYEYVRNSTDVMFKRFQSLQAGEYFLGRSVGPYSKLEQDLLGTSYRTQELSCSAKEGRFAEFARGRRVVVLMHELSMTGSPLAMMELASEIQSCGGKVSVVVLDKRGGLMSELVRRKLHCIVEKGGKSWRAASKAHLVVAGSAVCSSWIDNYLKYNRRGASRVVWWIMENRREYYERSKRILNKVGELVFLSKIQADQWKEWSKTDNVTFPSQPTIISLSVNEAIASVAGISIPQTNSATAVDKLRESVRKDMGLQPDETLFVSLSSINPGKGQHLALVAAASLLELQQQQSSMKRLVGSLGSKSNKPRSSMKLLFGSVGSKSNKAQYVDKMLEFLHKNPTLAKSILWTPASVSVSAIYAAADVYLINAQGIGETFGRVTVEAMAFGLPILGTDAGGTRELVEPNLTGLLHPVGFKGTANLTENMLFFMNNPTLGKEMGYRGREKVKTLYTKAFMYEKLAIVFSSCL